MKPPGPFRRMAVLAAVLSPAPAFAQAPSPATAVAHEYDAMGNPTRRIVAPGVLGLATQNTYDSLQRLRRVTDARAGQVDLSYLGGTAHLQQVLDPRRLATQYLPTGFGDLRTLSSPDTGTAIMTRDAAGNLSSRTDSRGVTASHSHDALNRLTQTTYSAGAAQAVYTWRYDETGPGFANGTGRLTSAGHPRGWSAFAYDAEGRVTVHTQQVTDESGTSALTTTVRYTYDAAGNRIRVTYPSGRMVNLTYTSGRLRSIDVMADANAGAVPVASQIGYTPAGEISGWTWHLESGQRPHGWVRDLQGRPVRYPLGVLLRDLSYDAAGRITAYTHSDAASGSAAPAFDQAFGYDELGRLTSAQTATATWSYAYDGNGNRTASSHNGYGASFVISPASNRLLAVPGATYGHDAAGNVTSIVPTFAVSPPTDRTMRYDLAGRMVAHQGPYLRGDYVVDGFGLRVLKIVSSVVPPGGYYAGPPPPPKVTVFAYDDEGRLLGEYDGATGGTLREYVWLGNTPVALLSANAGGVMELMHVHADHLDTPRVVVDRQGRVRWSWLAEPFGTTPANENPSGLGALAFGLRFPGQYFDAESGLHYNWHRDYEPGTGRYVQSDPIGLQGGINTYSYASGQPTMHTDRSGLWSRAIHDEVSRHAALRSGCSVRAEEIGQATASIDGAPNSQRPENSAWHGMSRPKMGTLGAELEFVDYLEQNLQSCSLDSLARRLHAIQDSLSPSHRGFKEWHGVFSLRTLLTFIPHAIGDTWLTEATRAEMLWRSEAVIREWKSRCPCSCDG